MLRRRRKSERDVLPRRGPTEGEHRPEALPQDGRPLGKQILKLKGLLRPTKRRSTPEHRRLLTRNMAARRISRAGWAAPSRAVNHAPGTHPQSSHSDTSSSCCRYCDLFSSRGPHRGHRVVLGDAEAETSQQTRNVMLPSHVASRRFRPPALGSSNRLLSPMIPEAEVIS